MGVGFWLKGNGGRKKILCDRREIFFLKKRGLRVDFDKR